MSLRAHHFVGRAEELRALEHVLAEVDEGRTAAIEVVGEAGIGKSRLLAELEARAEARGWLVLSGSASELERDLPFSSRGSTGSSGRRITARLPFGPR